jgi:hypothetical protein
MRAERRKELLRHPTGDATGVRAFLIWLNAGKARDQLFSSRDR